MSGKTTLTEDRKNQILDAAMETFTKKGIYKARMSDIAENSGLSKGSLYWYFDSKDSLILQLLKRFFEPELREFRSLLNDSGSAEQRLEIYTERVAEDMYKMLRWLPLLHDFISLAFRQEIFTKIISTYYQQNMEILISLLQQGIDSGEIKANSAREAAISIAAIIEGTAILYLYDPEGIDIKKHIKSNTMLLFNGLRNSPEKTQNL